jgi:nicotinate dehydrogenase subunit A
MTAPARHRLTVNGTPRTVEARPDTPLLHVLRDGLGLKGARYGCGAGRCGACTVLLDGRPVSSCDMAVEAAAGRAVTTVEGLGSATAPGPVQAAFLEAQAAQCGYCIDGMIVALTGLLAQSPRPDRAAVLAHLDERHLCRCGAHARILRVVDRLLAQPPGQGAP